MRLVVLAAGQGTRLRPLTDDRPKTLVPFMARPILEWTLDAASQVGLTDTTVVGGYRADRLEKYPVRHLVNPDYANTSMVGTLMVADSFFGDEFVMSYGDIVYRPEVLRAVIASTAEIGVVVDLDWRTYWERRFGDPLVDAESLRMGDDRIIRSIGQSVVRIEDIQGQYIGLVVFRGRGVKALRRVWTRAVSDAAYRRPILGLRTKMTSLAMTDVLNELATAGDVPVTGIPIHGGWVEIDSPEDLVVAEERWSAIPSESVVVDAPAPQAAPSASSGTAVRYSTASAPILPNVYTGGRRW